MKKILGKPRLSSRFPNSKNWVEKRQIRIYLNSLGYIDYDIQALIVNLFRIEPGGRPVSCREIANDYFDLFKHWVENTDF